MRQVNDFLIRNKTENTIFATKYSYFCILSKKEKLIKRFLEMPSDFRYDEVVNLLSHFGFQEIKQGKTSGSRVRFLNSDGVPLMLHKPHPTGIMKQYQLKQIKEILGL